MRVAAAILAAGSSSRVGFDKTCVDLAGKPVWKWSFDTYSASPEIDHVIVLTSPANASRVAATGAPIAMGGQTRQESVRKALESVFADVLLLHDAARPFVSQRVIGEVIRAVDRAGAAAAAVPVIDTIKEIGPDGVKTLERSRLIAMQTPQGARTDLLQRAHDSAQSEATDDMALLEKIGVQPEIVLGDDANFKITTPQDLDRARATAGALAYESRVGFGYDVHPFSPDKARTLMLGGVPFPGHLALEGHSDADVLIHAATDALLGAAGLGDIGRHFPNTDPRWKGEPSLTFLKAAAALLQESGWAIVNLDITVVAESPKITPRALEMIGCMARALAISEDRVSVKATTNEGMGFVGRREGIAATATCCIRRLN